MRIFLVILSAVVVLARTAATQTRPAAQDATPHVVMAFMAEVNGLATIDPIAVRTGRVYVPVAGYRGRVDAAGTRLRALAFGVEVGSVTLNPPTGGCSALTGRFTSPRGELPPASGLLVDGAVRASAAPLDRPATAAEQAALASFAQRILVAHGVPATQAAHASAPRPPQAITVRRGDPPVLTGGFELPLGPRVGHTVMVVLEGTAGAYRLAVGNYRGTDEPEAEHRMVVDAADLDGDGTAELVVFASHRASWTYHILSRSDGRWHEVFGGGGRECLGDR